MKKIISIALIGIFTITIGLISGCNTVKGVGRDVSEGGRQIQRAAS